MLMLGVEGSLSLARAARCLVRKLMAWHVSSSWESGASFVSYHSSSLASIVIMAVSMGSGSSQTILGIQELAIEKQAWDTHMVSFGKSAGL